MRDLHDTHNDRVSEYLGHLKFITMKKGVQVFEIIEEEKVEKIVNCLYINDVLPY
jgi:hypothetical protein